TAAWQKAIARGTPYELEYRVRRGDGSYGWELSRGVPVLGEDGSIAEWVGTALDVSERRQAEEERRRLLEREQAARADAEAAQRRSAQLQSITAALSVALTPEAVAQVVMRETMGLLHTSSGAVAVCDAART